MMLESAADSFESDFYEMPLENDIIDPLPMICAISIFQASVSMGLIAARFHNSLVRMSLRLAGKSARKARLAHGGNFRGSVAEYEVDES